MGTNSALSVLTFQQLSRSDARSLEILGTDCLPLKYDFWYWQMLTNTFGNTHFTLGAFLGNDLVGAVAAVKDATASYLAQNIKDEERFWLYKYNKIAYISSVIVHESMRRQGIASKLLRDVIQYLESAENTTAIYLHVMVTNQSAIRVYERLGFRYKTTLIGYYFHDKPALTKDAFLYIRESPITQEVCRIS